MEITYFKLPACPHCVRADQFLSELRAAEPRYAAIPITEIDESEKVALADSYDYYYVPCFFLGRQKLHEGTVTREQVRAVLEKAL